MPRLQNLKVTTKRNGDTVVKKKKPYSFRKKGEKR